MDPDRWLELLDEHGPLFDGDLDELLADEDSGEALEGALPDDLLYVGGDFLVRKSWLHDKVLTHRLTQAEVDADIVEVVPDWLAAVDLITETSDEIEQADGSRLRIIWGDEVGDEWDDHSVLCLLDAGYLRSQGLRANDLVGLCIDGQGVVRIAPVGQVGPVPQLDLDEPSDGSLVVWEWAKAGVLDLPRPPLTEIVAAMGMHLREDHIYPQDYDFAGNRFAAHLAAISEYNECDGEVALACAVLGTLLDFPDATLADLGVTPAQFQASLASPVACRIIGWETRAHRWEREAVMATLLSLGPFVGDASLSVRTLDALFTEVDGDVELAVEKTRRVFVDDPQWPPAITALVGYALAAGDAQRAADLLELLEGTEQRRAIVRSFLTGSDDRVGRNDKCPCGSGRKYKQCHLGKPILDAQRRARMVYEAALWYAYDTVPGVIDTLVELLILKVGEDAPGFDLVGDMVLKEWGLLAAYREMRGPLMPAEDLDLLDLWLAGPDRALFEVLDNTVAAMHVRDVATGDRLVVSERSAAPHMRPGSFWVSRIAAVGQTLQFFGGVYPVALHQREAVLDWISSPGARGSSDLLVLLAQNAAGPVLQTSTGEDLEICAALVRPHGDVSLLNGPFDARGSSWILLDGDTIHATIRPVGDHLRVETMSVAGMDVALSLIMQTLPGSEALEVTRQQPRARGSALTGAVVEQSRPPMSDAEESVLADYIDDYERKWLDLDIPALGGLTPRQAAADPTRRQDLIRLLASFGETDDATQMSPGRLRRMLGL